MTSKSGKGKIKRIAKKTVNILLDLLYPRKCIVCNVTVNIGRGINICSDCDAVLGKYSKTVVEPDRYFEYAVCALPYDGNIKSAILRYKFGGSKYLSETFGEVAARAAMERSDLTHYDIICPVPIHAMRQRDYNQSLLLACKVSERMHIPVCGNLLLKLRHIMPLSGMGAHKRKAKIEGAISYNYRYDIIGKSILLVDDIFTTGATVNECARVLRMHGAKNVTVIAACYADVKGE